MLVFISLNGQRLKGQPYNSGTYFNDWNNGLYKVFVVPGTIHKQLTKLLK